MPTFDAGNVVEPMHYNFTKYEGGEEGTVPEPSDRQIAVWYREIANLTEKIAKEKANLTGEVTPQQLLEAMEGLTTGDIYEEMLKGTTEIYARVCSNKPSKKQLLLLPPRVRIHFFRWMSGQLRPEAEGAVGTDQVTDLRSASGA